ncbi:MAG: peptidylprolyl isomerase, partial [Gemmatimonadetes bacterium]|nr:peptidylprolyl isomerase [Gemmatimonadota bacterium]
MNAHFKVPRIIGLCAAAMLAGCGADAPPALEVGDLAYESSEVLGLTDDRLLLLGELAAFGTAVADSSLADLGRPWIDGQARAQLWRRTRAQQVLDSAGVGEEVLRARYRTEPELELTVRHLLVFSARYETDRTRAAARGKAEAALARIQAGEPFARVAAEVSEEPGAESREGLLTPGREGAWVSEFWAAATALAPDEISPVVETQYGFHVLRLEARDTVAFEEARPRIALEVAELMGFRDFSVDDVPLPADAAPGSSAAYGPDPGAADDAVLAEGTGWRVDRGLLRDVAALLRYSDWQRYRAGGDPDLHREVFERAVRHAVVGAMDAAASLDPVRAASEREWIDRGETWALQLGFAPG